MFKKIDLTLYNYERNLYQEVITPSELRKKLFKMFENVKITADFRILDLCSGKGHLTIEIIKLCMSKLKLKIKDEEERYKYILENMIFMCDIEINNNKFIKFLLDPEDKYKLNIHHGDILEHKYKKKFDIIISNPPYNKTINKGNSIYYKFINYSLDNVKKGGYIGLITPPNYRKYNMKTSFFHGIFKRINETMHFKEIQIFNLKDGKKYFKKGVRFDIYMIHNTHKKDLKTVIIDEDRKKININIQDMEFLPNKNIELIKKFLGSFKKRVFMGTFNKEKKHKKTITFKFPCVHSILKDRITYKYSDKQKRKRKIIMCNSSHYKVICDYDGYYGVSSNSCFYPFDTKKEGRRIYKILSSDIFKIILDSCKWGTFKKHWEIINVFDIRKLEEYINKHT